MGTTEMINYSRFRKMVEPPNFGTIMEAFNSVWDSQELTKAKIKNREETKSMMMDRLCGNSKIIQRNVNVIAKCVTSKKWIKKECCVSLDDLIAFLGSDEELKRCYSDYYAKKPDSLFKYVKKKRVCPSIINNNFKCGTAKEYRIQDPRDSIPLLDYEEEISDDDLYELIQQEVVNKMLDKKNISVEEKRKDINDLVGNLYYIGCLSDNPNLDNMWETYGKDGVCIEFDTSDLNVHKVTYSDMPLEPKYIRNKFKALNSKSEKGTKKEIKRQTRELIKLVSGMGLLNLFRKDYEQFHEEHEWRLLEDSNKLESDDGVKYKKARILRIISDLPEDLDIKLRDYCRNNDIIYERRNGNN